MILKFEDFRTIDYQTTKIMKKLLLILLCLPMIGFGQKTFVTDDNFEKINTLKTLQFPSISTFADSVLYLGCENIIFGGSKNNIFEGKLKFKV